MRDSSTAKAERHILLSDPTLRDGNHAIGHRLTLDNIRDYCLAADAAGIPIVEVGHGNGVGASSLQVGLAAERDCDMLRVARGALTSAKLGIHAIPGFATIDRDLRPAVDAGVDVIRTASHCTEADTQRKHIGFSVDAGCETYATLMMCHMAPVEVLLEEARKVQDYGAKGVILMDSAGALMPDDVSAVVGSLASHLTIDVGFHGHNNLGLAIGNSLAAARAGARIIDGTTMGFGAGAGNTQLEVLVAVLEKGGYTTGVDMRRMGAVIDAASRFARSPAITYSSLASGLAGVFSGFQRHVSALAERYGQSEWDIYMELGRRKMIAGQEDHILEVAQALARGTE